MYNYICEIYVYLAGSGEMVSTIKASHCEEWILAALLFVPLSVAVVCS